MRQGSINATKILVREVEKKEAVTKAGIILTNIAVKEPQICGEVIQVGSGLLPNVPMETKIGERVLFYPNAAQKFNIDEDSVMLLDCRDILFRYTVSDL
jgi:co-chaperonin GroES (HSP10)